MLIKDDRKATFNNFDAWKYPPFCFFLCLKPLGGIFPPLPPSHGTAPDADTCSAGIQLGENNWMFIMFRKYHVICLFSCISSILKTEYFVGKKKNEIMECKKAHFRPSFNLNNFRVSTKWCFFWSSDWVKCTVRESSAPTWSSKRSTLLLQNESKMVNNWCSVFRSEVQKINLYYLGPKDSPLFRGSAPRTLQKSCLCI